jgi:hypothetical protein
MRSHGREVFLRPQITNFGSCNNCLEGNKVLSEFAEEQAHQMLEMRVSRIILRGDMIQIPEQLRLLLHTVIQQSPGLAPIWSEKRNNEVNGTGWTSSVAGSISSAGIRTSTCDSPSPCAREPKSLLWLEDGVAGICFSTGPSFEDIMQQRPEVDRREPIPREKSEYR